MVYRIRRIYQAITQLVDIAQEDEFAFHKYSGVGIFRIFYHHQIFIPPRIALFLSLDRLLNLLSSYYKLTIKLLASLLSLYSLIFLLLFFSQFTQFQFPYIYPDSFLFLNFLSSFYLFGFLINPIKLFLIILSCYNSIFLSLLVAYILDLSR